MHLIIIIAVGVFFGPWLLVRAANRRFDEKRRINEALYRQHRSLHMILD
jgi:hypothetical protein